MAKSIYLSETLGSNAATIIHNNPSAYGADLLVDLTYSVGGGSASNITLYMAPEGITLGALGMGHLIRPAKEIAAGDALDDKVRRLPPQHYIAGISSVASAIRAIGTATPDNED